MELVGDLLSMSLCQWCLDEELENMIIPFVSDLNFRGMANILKSLFEFIKTSHDIIMVKIQQGKFQPAQMQSLQLNRTKV